jgi:ATP-dependent DNA helicase RecG
MHHIEKLIAQGEGLTIEFKRAKSELPSSLFETVCAFLNRGGGTILLGVNDEKTIEGVDAELAKKMCKNIANLSNNPQKLFPAFLLTATAIEFYGKTLIFILVPISSQVHRTNGKIFDRSEDGDFELKTDEQIKQLYNRKSILYTENRIYPYLTENHFASGIVERARRMIKNNRPDHPWNDLNDMDFFITAGLYRNDMTSGQEGFTLAALLLFGRDEIIQSAIPH